MTDNITILGLNECELSSLSGDVVFYRCNPQQAIDKVHAIDITKQVFHYISENINEFNSYIKQYIPENENDARIALSRLFEFHTINTYANSALELIGVQKIISSLKREKITLVLSDEYNPELVKTAFDPQYKLKIKSIWLLKYCLDLAFYLFCFLPLARFKQMTNGKPVKADILFHSFVIGDVQHGYKIDPYFSELIDTLKKQGATVNRLVSFVLLSPLNTLKSLWKIDTREFILPEASLSIKEIWKSVRACIAVKNHSDLKPFRFDGYDLTNYFRVLSRYISVRTIHFRFDLMRKYMKKTRNHYKVIIIQNENYFYQRGLINEAKRSGHNIKCITYQFGQLNPYNPNHHYIFPEKYQPDIIFASGSYYADFMVNRLGYPIQKVKEAYSLQIPYGTKYKRDELPVICIYISDIYAEAVATYHYITNHLYPERGNFKIGIRLHPYCSEEIKRMFNSVNYFEYTDPEESYFRSDCFLSSGASTIIFSAATSNKPVYILDVPNMPRWYDQHDLKNLKYINPDEDIKIEFFSDLNFINETSNCVKIEDTCESIMMMMQGDQLC